MASNHEDFNWENKRIPPSLKEEITFALSHYPELKDNPVDFVFTRRMKKSFMQAQPRWEGLFQKGHKRAYMVKIAPTFHLLKQAIRVEDIPEEVMIGWIAHELGHIMDYYDRSALSLLGFGVGYLTSKRYLMGAERVADIEAVSHGLGYYILATKDFILNHAHISEKYKARIDKLYMSPEELIEVIEKSGWE